MKAWKIKRDALELSVLFFPLMSLSRLVETVLPLLPDFWGLTLAGAVLCFFAALSESGSDAARKWGLSLLFTVGFWLLLGVTDFDLRLINSLNPGYGGLPAGAGLGALLQFAAFSLLRGWRFSWRPASAAAWSGGWAGFVFWSRMSCSQRSAACSWRRSCGWSSRCHPGSPSTSWPMDDCLLLPIPEATNHFKYSLFHAADNHQAVCRTFFLKPRQEEICSFPGTFPKFVDWDSLEWYTILVSS